MKARCIVAMLMVSCLMATVLPGWVSAESLSMAPLKQTEGVSAELMGTRDYDFDFNIPARGTEYDSRTFTMSASKYCIVQRTDSNYGTGSFRVVDASTLAPLGDWVVIDRGDSALIYTNTSGQTQYVRIEYSSRNVLSVHAVGWFKFGEFDD
ncbi:MAG TPA: hypothetical protein DDZ53_05240 [Firmicutes bacterium]|nr:hypothetical protein [Bacillota bacterium]